MVIDARCRCTTWPLLMNGNPGRCGRCGERPYGVQPTNVYDTEDPNARQIDPRGQA